MIQKLFNTRGLGQWDDLCVRPDSKRLPSFFDNEKGGPNCCGSQADRIITTTTTTSTSSNNGDKKANDSDGTADFKIIDVWWEIWISGCFVGVVGTLSVMRALKRKTTMRS